MIDISCLDLRDKLVASINIQNEKWTNIVIVKYHFTSIFTLLYVHHYLT